MDAHDSDKHLKCYSLHGIQENKSRHCNWQWVHIAHDSDKNSKKCWSLHAGVNILAHAPINIVETNKHFGKRWKGIRKIQHL